MIAKLNDISFPVYLLPEKPIVDGSVSFYLRGKDTDYSDAMYKILVIDDKGIPGDTLASRRMKLLTKKITLYKLKVAIFFVSDFIKLASKSSWFIDSNGKLFNYTKTSKVPLVFKEIRKIIPTNSGGLIVEVEGIPSRYKTLMPLRSYKDVPKYAGLLKVDSGYILYGLYPNKLKDTNRMI